MSSCGSNAGMETHAPLINGIVNINETLRRIIPAPLYSRFVAEFCPRFAVEWAEVTADLDL